MPDETALDLHQSRPSAYVEAQRLLGLGTVTAIRKAAMRVVWAHTWRALWSWHWDAKEVLVEIVIDTRVPEDVRARAQAICEREV